MEELLKKTKQFKYISVDLFDTLMYRIVSKPELIFDLVEREYNRENQKWITGFRKRRIKAETLARKKPTIMKLLLIRYILNWIIHVKLAINLKVLKSILR